MDVHFAGNSMSIYEEGRYIITQVYTGGATLVVGSPDALENASLVSTYFSSGQFNMTSNAAADIVNISVWDITGDQSDPAIIEFGYTSASSNPTAYSLVIAQISSGMASPTPVSKALRSLQAQLGSLQQEMKRIGFTPNMDDILPLDAPFASKPRPPNERPFLRRVASRARDQTKLLTRALPVVSELEETEDIVIIPPTRAEEPVLPKTIKVGDRVLIRK